METHPLLNGQPVTADSLLLYRSQTGMFVVNRATDRRYLRRAVYAGDPIYADSYTHLEYIAMYPTTAKNWYGWPDLRQITQYLAEQENKDGNHPRRSGDHA